jgi:hypothetical protein
MLLSAPFLSHATHSQIHFCLHQAEKGRAAASSRVLLLHRFLGLRHPQTDEEERRKKEEEEDEIENSVEGVSFLLLLVQELFPSWRYGGTCVCNHLRL